MSEEKRKAKYNEYARKYRDTHREQVRAKALRWSQKPSSKHKYWVRHLSRRYGITEEEYNTLLEEQGGVCAICHQPETKTMNGILVSLAVDHDHFTGKVRGLLCDRCNIGLSKFLDNPSTLASAIVYLEGAR